MQIKNFNFILMISTNLEQFQLIACDLMKLLASRSRGARKRGVEYCFVVGEEIQGEKRKFGLADFVHAISPSVTLSLSPVHPHLSHK
jgi:hypothetical protein